MQVFLMSVNWVSTYGEIFQEVPIDGAQQVPLKPETQTQGIRLTHIPLELKKGSLFIYTVKSVNLQMLSKKAAFGLILNNVFDLNKIYLFGYFHIKRICRLLFCSMHNMARVNALM